MTNYTTLGHNLKRGIFKFCEKICVGFSKPFQKFIFQMIFGLLSGRKCFLTEIARKLNEKIPLCKTVERLSRNLMNFDGADELHENYICEAKKHFDDTTVLLFDDSDIAKSKSKKLEALCGIYDGSEGETSIGYWYAGVSALTCKNQQPIPVYSRIYSSLEDDYDGNNAETIKSLEFVSKHFSQSNIRAFDRGYDSGFVFDYLIKHNEKFIIRMKDRYVLHKGRKVLIKQLCRKYKGKYSLNFKSKDGKEINCKISIIPVSLPDYPDKILNLVICNKGSKEPMMLLTNLESEDARLCVTVVKVYLMRWRIEEYYKFKKQGFAFEKFLVRSLKSIRNLDTLLTIAIGYIGTLSEKIDESIMVAEVVEASKRLYGLSKFTFYAIADGLTEIFNKLYTGIECFFRPPINDGQLCFESLE